MGNSTAAGPIAMAQIIIPHIFTPATCEDPHVQACLQEGKGEACWLSCFWVPSSTPLGGLTREGAARKPAHASSRRPWLQEHEVHVLLLVHFQCRMLVRHPLCNDLRSISDQLPVASANVQ